MNPFNLSNEALERSKNLKVVEKVNKEVPIIIEGADVFDVLCPVSKKTGHRENPLSLLARVLPPDKERLASLILQEIPSIQQEDPNISDSDAIDMCVQRFSTGTPYEDQQIRSALFDAADVLFPQMSEEQRAAVVEPSSPAAEVDPNV